MKRASQLFSEKDKRRVSEAIQRAELKTSAEIVPAVATASGRYDRAEDICGLLTGFLLLSLGWVTCRRLHPAADWDGGMLLSFSGLVPVLVTLVAGFVVGSALASRAPVLRLPFIPQKEMDDEVKRAAEAVFMSSKIRKTRGGTGVLLYVSLFERKVVVLPDDAITDRLPQQTWGELCEILVGEMKKGQPVEALEEAILRCGGILSEILPRADDDVDELSNDLILID